MSNSWITAYKDDVYHLELSVDSDIYCIHTKVLGRINKRNLEVLREAFKEICLYLDSIGVVSLFALTPSVKFAKLVTGDSFQYVGKIKGQQFIVWNLGEYLWP